MPINNDLIRNILSDMKVELTEMFDRNFVQKSFFGEKWPPRKDPKAKGSLLIVTGKMRRSIRSAIQGNSLRFTSALPYTGLHNTGGTFTQRVRAHTRKNRKTGSTHTVRAHSRTMVMPRRQFIGDHPQVREAVKTIITENVSDYFHDLANKIRKQ